MGADVLASRGDRLAHPVKDEETATLGLCQRLAHDLRRDAADLDVHLKSGDAFLRSGHLEVHVAVMIFCSSNVGKDGVIFAFLHQAHCDSGHWCFQRHTGIHEAERAAADGRHRRGAIRLHDVADNAHCVREIIHLWQDG